MNNNEKKTYEPLLAEMGRPVNLDSVLNRNMDLKGLIRYARSQGKRVSELSEMEKKPFLRA